MYYTKQELADYLKMSIRTIDNWIKEGSIPFSKFGKSVRFDKEKIDEWRKEKEI